MELLNKSFGQLEWVLISFACVVGLSVFFIPLHYSLLFVIFLLVIFGCLQKPERLFYLMAVCLTIQKYIRVGEYEFFLYELALLLCLITCVFYVFCKNKVVNISTKLDWLFLLLFVVYTYSGIISHSEKGLFYSLKYYETIILFYLTVYFIRIKMVKVTRLLYVTIMIAVAQSVFAVLQSMIGDGSILPIWLSSHFGDNRGILGYLGLGSSFVWHGRGLFTHFIHFGMYVSLIMIIFHNLKDYFFKNKWIVGFIYTLLFAALCVSYSRSALMVYILSIFYMYAIANKKKFYRLAGTSVLFLAPIAGILTGTSYIRTLNPRNRLWDILCGFLSENKEHLLLGTGFDSFHYWVTPILRMLNAPLYVHPHSTYLEVFLYTGILGFVILSMFLIFMFIETKRRSQKRVNFMQKYNFAAHVIVFSMFFAGIFDRTYFLYSFLAILSVLAGVLYAVDKPTEKYVK